VASVPVVGYVRWYTPSMVEPIHGNIERIDRFKEIECIGIIVEHFTDKS
jgi:hypothetical protein